MTKYHAVMLDETGCEFGAEVEADSRDEAYDILGDDYPESRVVQLESPEESDARERRAYEHAERCYEDPYYEIDHCHEWEY